MSNKKVIIIGGGVAGFSAGTYLQLNGYETEIIEKNPVAGGSCICWERSGCYIDGCRIGHGTFVCAEYRVPWR